MPRISLKATLLLLAAGSAPWPAMAQTCPDQYAYQRARSDLDEPGVLAVRGLVLFRRDSLIPTDVPREPMRVPAPGETLPTDTVVLSTYRVLVERHWHGPHADTLIFQTQTSYTEPNQHLAVGWRYLLVIPRRLQGAWGSAETRAIAALRVPYCPLTWESVEGRHLEEALDRQAAGQPSGL